MRNYNFFLKLHLLFSSKSPKNFKENKRISTKNKPIIFMCDTVHILNSTLNSSLNTILATHHS